MISALHQQEAQKCQTKTKQLVAISLKPPLRSPVLRISSPVQRLAALDD
jgi:hypothetical protein